MQLGITTKKAEELLKQEGYNELPSAKSKSIWRTAFEVIKEPMFILLLGSGTLYFLLGDFTEGIVLLCSIFVIIFITFFQQRKTEKSLEALRQLASPRALVIRDGKETRIAGREVVPSDVILLNEGDRVPADAVLIESNNLTVDESLLTGESVPVIKTVGNDSPARENQIFSGTLVVRGKGMAEVFSTGINTQFGKIGASLKSIEQDNTRLQREMKLLTRNLFFIGTIVSVVIVATIYFTRGNFLESLLNGLAASIAILPEEFPVVLTVFLAVGAWRLSKNNVLTRKPSAIETLGSATVLCSDKTGTITQNKMEIAALYCNEQLYFKSDFTNSKDDSSALLKTLFYASQQNAIDPMEKAIASEYGKYNKANEKVRLLKEYPLSNELFAMSRAVQCPNEEALTVYCKGAPEAVFKLCRLSPAAVAKYMEAVQQLAEKGYRVLAAAQSKWHNAGLPEKQMDFDFRFTGLVAFEDPIRAEVPGAIKECNQAGIKVIMITGDYPVTAKNIAAQIGLQHNDKVLTGADLQTMSEDRLKEEIKHTRVFARIIPAQKLQIIHALKASGEIVAMTGDGVNDAPALKAADIGVAMGLKGTDVAREASSLVILDDNFASIVHAIRSGRKIFDNLQKAMSYIIAIHIPIIGLVLLPAFFPSLPILLMPLHIVFMELIIDPVCAIAFETEQEEKLIMNRPPRKPDELFFGFRKIFYSVFKGLLLLGMVIGVYFLSINEGHTAGEIRAIAFSSLIIGNLFLILTSLSNTRSFISVFLEKNIAVFVISILAMTMLGLIITIPALQKIFNFNFPGYAHFLSSLIGALIILATLELVKMVEKRMLKRISN